MKSILLFGNLSEDYLCKRKINILDAEWITK